MTKSLKQARARIDGIARDVGKRMAKAVVEATPATTGLARANWQAGVNRAPKGKVDTPDKTGKRAIAAMNKTIAKARPATGDTIHIVNNAPEAIEAERGTSGKSARSIKAAAKRRLPAMVKKALRNSK